MTDYSEETASWHIKVAEIQAMLRQKNWPLAQRKIEELQASLVSVDEWLQDTHGE